MSNFSRVEIEEPDLARCPRFSRATPLRAILEPSDFLYLPIYWWHQFRKLEASLNVNFRWQARPRNPRKKLREATRQKLMGGKIKLQIETRKCPQTHKSNRVIFAQHLYNHMFRG